MAFYFAAFGFVGPHYSLQRSENVQIAAKVPFNCAVLPWGAQLAPAHVLRNAGAFFSNHD